MLKKAESVLWNTSRKRKGRAKDKGQEARFSETLLLKGSMPKRRGKVFLERKIVLSVSATQKTEKSLFGKEDRPQCFSYRRGNCSHDRECDYWHLPHCKYSKKNTCEMRKDLPFIHSQYKGKRKIVRKREGNDCYCEYCKSSTRGQVMEVHAS